MGGAGGPRRPRARVRVLGMRHGDGSQKSASGGPTLARDMDCPGRSRPTAAGVGGSRGSGRAPGAEMCRARYKAESWTRRRAGNSAIRPLGSTWVRCGASNADICRRSVQASCEASGFGAGRWARPRIAGMLWRVHAMRSRDGWRSTRTRSTWNPGTASSRFLGSPWLPLRGSDHERRSRPTPPLRARGWSSTSTVLHQPPR